MRQVEYAFYILPPAPGRRAPYRSRFMMTAEEAAQRGALHLVPGTAVLRNVPETEEEQLRATAQYPSAGRDSVKAPRG